jgi:hypothetical protein
MTIARIIIMASILSSIFGCGGQNNKAESKDIYPKESFSVLNAKFNGKQVVGSFNMAYKNYDQKEKYPWCLEISIGLNLDSLNENGLPNHGESAIAYQLEDELVGEVKKITTAHYIGHLFNDTFLDVYIYLDDPKKIHAFLQTQINKPGLLRGFGYEINKDPTWSSINSIMK